MADEVVLYNRQARAVATAEGGQALFIGALLTAGGAGLLVTGLGIVAGAGAPRIVLGLLGVDVLLAGLLFVVHGVRGTRKRKRVAEAEAQRGGLPWTWDYTWNPAGIADENPRTALRATTAGIVMMLFLLPFNAILLLSKGVPKAVFLAAAIGDLIFLVPLGIAVYLWLQVARSGRVRARFDNFPFRLGNRLSTQLQLPGYTRELSNMKATLRCIEERHITMETPGDSHTSTQLFELYAAEQAITIEPGPSNSARATVSLNLPEGDYATRLSRLPPRYWQLELTAERPGIDYDVRLLMPIY